jgi:hypothetical protein
MKVINTIETIASYKCEFCGFKSLDKYVIYKHERLCVVKALIPFIPKKLQKNSSFLAVLERGYGDGYYTYKDFEKLLLKPYWYAVTGDDSWWCQIRATATKKELLLSIQKFCEAQLNWEDDHPEIVAVCIKGDIKNVKTKVTVKVNLV